MAKSPVLIRISTRVPWLVTQDHGDGHWFGVCPPLNLNAAGDTWDDFVDCMKESIGLLLQNLLKHGELESFLKRQGWATATPLPPPGTKARFDVPWEISHRNRIEEFALTQ